MKDRLSERNQLTGRGGAAWLLFSLLFNVGMMLLLYRLFDPVFEGNDDVTIVQFVNGSCGSFDPHMVYQNYLMGILLSNLYRFFPAIPWYSWMQFWALCAAFTAVTYVLGRRIRWTAGFAFGLLLQSFAAYECYINLQYTKTAGVLAAAGMLLFWHGLWGGPGFVSRDAGRIPAAGKILPASVLAGGLLSLWSVLYRPAQFAACAALTAGIPLLMLLDCAVRKDPSPASGDPLSEAGEGGPSSVSGSLHPERETGGSRAGAAVKVESINPHSAGEAGGSLEARGSSPADEGNAGGRVRALRMFRRCLFACILLGAACAALVLFDREMYVRDPEWKNYVEYNAARSELMDYGMPKYEEYGELYEELGVNRTAYDLFDTWNSGDTRVFSTEVMKKLAAAREKRRPGAETLKAFVKEVPKGFLKNRIFRCFLVLAALWVLLGRHDWRAHAALLGEGLLFVLLYYYLFLKGRYLYNRVDAGLWMSVILVLLWTCKGGFKRAWADHVRTVLILAVMAACVFVQIPGWKGRLASHNADGRAHRREVRAQMKVLAADQDHLYVSKLGILSASRFCRPFEPMPVGILSNTVVLGGWKVESVPYNAILKKHGFSDNPYEAIAGNTDRADEVILLDHDPEATLAYLREYYDPSAQVMEAGEWTGETLYRVVCTDVEP